MTDFSNSEQKNFDAEENDFSNISPYLRQSTNFSKNLRLKNSNSDEDSPQNVMERFIMTIRALEATWAEFTNSKEYAELPDNKHEEEILNLIGGDKTNRNRYKQIEKPNATTLNAVAAYRNSMTFFPRKEES